METVEYWRNKVEELEKEFEEYRENSQMLEKELESSLEQADKKNMELRLRNNTIQLENETLKDKLEELQNDNAQLQEEATRCQAREEEYINYIRELEQKNDDLERSKRVLYMSLTEFEVKLNSALERNVLLESELDEKASLADMNQRLKDESRDLKQELQVVRGRCGVSDNDKARIVDSNKLDSPESGIPPTGHSVSSFRSINQPHIVSNGLTPPPRISALNVVGDLLRKVGSLEARLASCQSHTRDCMSPGEGRDQHRARRLNRGTSSPTINNLVQL